MKLLRSERVRPGGFNISEKLMSIELAEILARMNLICHPKLLRLLEAVSICKAVSRTLLDLSERYTTSHEKQLKLTVLHDGYNKIRWLEI